MRQAIFISHATPEDNDFVRWLGSKLSLAGYTVWHDLECLKGGDLFWDKIEGAIRNDAVRFIAVVSKVAIEKDGVKNEWSLAGSIERSIPGFVIPVRVDHLAFGQLPITIHRKNTIDFTGGWHEGLARLLETLADAKIPRSTDIGPWNARQWLAEKREGAILRTESPERLDASWLEILSLPASIETARILGSIRAIPETAENRQLPWFVHGNLVVGIAKASELVRAMVTAVMLEESSAVATGEFVREGSNLGERRVPAWEAQRRVVHLVRQAWELAFEVKGFGCAHLAGGKKIFYATPELTGGRGKLFPYQDFDGRARRKALNGKSEKRSACWCYGVGIVPKFDDPWRVELRSAVVFTDDDGRLVDDPAKAHRLRQGFCKNWWNEQSRTLMRAYLWLASDGHAAIRLTVGSGREIVVAATPMQFMSPSGLSDLGPVCDAEPIEEADDGLGVSEVEDDMQ